jgi:hypothetical protein
MGDKELDMFLRRHGIAVGSVPDVLTNTGENKRTKRNRHYITVMYVADGE